MSEDWELSGPYYPEKIAIHGGWTLYAIPHYYAEGKCTYYARNLSGEIHLLDVTGLDPSLNFRIQLIEAFPKLIALDFPKRTNAWPLTFLEIHQLYVNRKGEN